MCKDNFKQRQARSAFWTFWRSQHADTRRMYNSSAVLKGWMAAHESFEKNKETPAPIGDLMLLYVDLYSGVGRIPVVSVGAGIQHVARFAMSMDTSGLRIADFCGEGGCERVFARYDYDKDLWTTIDSNNKVVVI